jgi:hypothetical protein
MQIVRLTDEQRAQMRAVLDRINAEAADQPPRTPEPRFATGGLINRKD